MKPMNLRSYLMNRSFFTKVFVSICFVAFFGTFSISMIYQYYFQTTMVNIEMERVQRSVDQAVLHLDTQIKQTVNDMYYFMSYTDTGTEMIKADSNNAEEVDRFGKALEAFRLRNSGELESVFFYRETGGNPNGIFFYDSNLSRNLSIDYRKQQWYLNFKRKSDQLWTLPTRDHIFYQDRSLRSMWLTKGKYGVNGRDGIFVVRFNAKMFSDAFRLIAGDNLRIQLVEGGEMVYSTFVPDPQGETKSTKPGVGKSVDRPVSRSDEGWIFKTTRMDNANIDVNFWVNKKAIIDKARQIIPAQVLIVAIVLLITFPISILLSLSLMRPIKLLLRLMKQVEIGDFSARYPIQFTDEISRLGKGFNHMISHVDDLIREVYVIRMEKMESELHQKEATILAMQNQVNPHFLYNTLETINCHAILNDVVSISHMSQALADFFRYSIDNRSIEVILDKEMLHAQTYLKIQQERYPDIEVDFSIPDEFKRFLIIKLTLQPIIENAYQHAFVGERKYFINIHADHVDDDRFAVYVEDNGEGMDMERMDQMNAQFDSKGPLLFPDNEPNISSHGIGLSNVHIRIRLHYGEPYGIRLSESSAGGLCVRILLPASFNRPIL